MDEEELKKKINELTKEVQQLQTKKQKYVNLRTSLMNFGVEPSAVLVQASKQIDAGYNSLRSNYETNSEIAGEYFKNIEKDKEKIEDIFRTIKNKMLPEISAQIDEISEKITNNQRSIRMLTQILDQKIMEE